jgi:hypothetical protein
MTAKHVNQWKNIIVNLISNRLTTEQNVYIIEVETLKGGITYVKMG